MKTVADRLPVVLEFDRPCFLTPVLSLRRRSELGIRGEVGLWLDVRLSRGEESLLSV